MRTYEYRCVRCHATMTSTTHGLDVCLIDGCLGALRRVYSISFTKPLQEHWNTTVNKPIRTNKQFADELKRASEEATLRTGVEHRYVPTDPSAVGATQEGMESTYREQRNAGKTESKLIL